ncbi:hypothetical protein [Methylobacterium sp. 37f]|uniref:hypothetical protein n=1 Tax=Methylobacterium sp. 37f TaxID=2817058 RepID=UPI001FFD6B73|nr:hypothetical protein [Methylobacterium sp. 37f]MCK2052940.1 hypothetical protein [Methylobacterium sp. 37f]
MSSADFHTARAAEPASPERVPASPGRLRASPILARPVLRAFGVLASGLLAMLLLVCAVLPLLRMAGEVPRGFERQAVMASSTLPPNRDTNLRISAAMIDLDDSYGNVAALRIPQATEHRTDRLVLPRVLPAPATRAVAPPDRPPRLVLPA